VVKVVDFNHLSLTAVGSNPDRDFGFFRVTQPKIIHGRAPEVFLHQ
jgi:hypothetical protein